MSTKAIITTPERGETILHRGIGLGEVPQYVIDAVLGGPSPLVGRRVSKTKKVGEWTVHWTSRRDGQGFIPLILSPTTSQGRAGTYSLAPVGKEEEETYVGMVEKRRQSQGFLARAKEHAYAAARPTKKKGRSRVYEAMRQTAGEGDIIRMRRQFETSHGDAATRKIEKVQIHEAAGDENLNLWNTACVPKKGPKRATSVRPRRRQLDPKMLDFSGF